MTDSPRSAADPATAALPAGVRRRALWPWLLVAIVLVLVGGGAAVLQSLGPPPPRPVARVAGADAEAIAALAARVARLEQAKPAPVAASDLPAPDLAPPDLAPIQQRLAALEARPVGGDAAAQALSDRLAALETRTGEADARAQALAGRLDALRGDLAGQLNDLQTRLAQAQGLSAQLASLSDRAERLAMVQAARAALDAGQKLGDLPGAPPALQRFAHAAPPTEAALRLEFPALADAAEDAARPDGGTGSTLGRMWRRVQEQITLRQGSRVIVGNPAAGAIALAGASLAAGDLAGAVAAVAELSGPAAVPLADWLDRARALLAARAALLDMAAHA